MLSSRQSVRCVAIAVVGLHRYRILGIELRRQPASPGDYYARRWNYTEKWLLCRPDNAIFCYYKSARWRMAILIVCLGPSSACRPGKAMNISKPNLTGVTTSVRYTNILNLMEISWWMTSINAVMKYDGFVTCCFFGFLFPLAHPVYRSIFMIRFARSLAQMTCFTS